MLLQVFSPNIANYMQLNILKILTQSLDIKLIATLVDENIDFSQLEELGINAVAKS